MFWASVHEVFVSFMFSHSCNCLFMYLIFIACEGLWRLRRSHHESPNLWHCDFSNYIWEIRHSYYFPSPVWRNSGITRGLELHVSVHLKMFWSFHLWSIFHWFQEYEETNRLPFCGGDVYLIWNAVFEWLLGASPCCKWNLLYLKTMFFWFS